MNTFIVTFHLAYPANNAARLAQKVRTYSQWALLFPNTFLIKTDLTVVQVRDQLQPFLQAADKLFVGNCPVPSAWNGLADDVSKWIVQNQTKVS